MSFICKYTKRTHRPTHSQNEARQMQQTSSHKRSHAPARPRAHLHTLSHMHLHTHTHTHTHTRSDGQTQTHRHTHMNTHTHSHTHTYTHTHTHTHTCTRACAYTHMHAQRERERDRERDRERHTHKHTHTHTPAQIWARALAQFCKYRHSPIPCICTHTRTTGTHENTLSHTYLRTAWHLIMQTIKIVPMILILHDHAQSKFFARVVGCRGPPVSNIIKRERVRTSIKCENIAWFMLACYLTIIGKHEAETCQWNMLVKGVYLCETLYFGKVSTPSLSVAWEARNLLS